MTAVPKLRFKQENGSDYPDWKAVALGDVVEIKRGQAIKSEIEGKYELLGMGSVNIVGGLVHGSKTNQEKNMLRMYDLVMPERDIGKGLIIGRVAIIPQDNKYILGGNILSLTVKNSRNHNVKVLHAYLNSNFIREKFSKIVNGTSQLMITSSEVKKVPLILPNSSSEQQKIASFLTSVDKKIDLLRQKKDALELYKKGLMQKIFSQEIRFKQDDGSDFPDWEDITMKKLMSERNEQAPQSEDYPLMAFIAHKGVAPKGDRYNRNFLVKDEKGKKYKKTELGDFIYSSNNLETGSIGVNSFGPASISPVYSIFKTHSNCDFKFMSELLSRPEFIYKMVRFRQGVVYGQWRIHETDFLNIQQSIPSLPEQQKIASLLSSVDAKIQNTSSQIGQMETFKKGLLQQMFV